MGYRRGRKTYRLLFEDMPGLEVKAHGVPMGRLLGMVGLSALGEGGFRPADVEKIDDLIGLFAGSLVSWNLEDDNGVPVLFDPEMIPEVIGAEVNEGGTIRFVAGTPARMETDDEAKARVLKGEDTDFVLSMILAWIDAVVNVSGPLKRTSSGGDQSPADALPMVTL